MALIRCDECERIYTGDLNESAQVYETSVSAVGDTKASKIPTPKHLCQICRELAQDKK